MVIKRLLSLVAVVMLAGCAAQPSLPEREIENRREALVQQSASRVVEVLPTPYLGAASVPITEDRWLNKKVALSLRGTLTDICAELGGLLQKSVDAEPMLLLQEQRVRYEGSVRGLLEHVAIQYGAGWEYFPSSDTISFSRMQTKTFTLLAAPGSTTYKNQITNQSSKNDYSNGMMNAVSSSDTSSQTAQTNTTTYQGNVWKETVENIKGMLTKEGFVTANPVSGTITVKDTAPSLREVAAFIQTVNSKLSKQVALDVRVWQLEISDEKEAGLNMQALFESGSLSLSSGATLNLSKSGGTLGASITSGKLKGSEATFKALAEFGKTTLLTSGGGITMNNMPLPVGRTESDTYLAKVSMQTGDYGQMTEIIPGETTNGFSMTVIPHILDRRTLILQYNCSLTSLDALREYSNASVKIEMPKVSTRAFSQRVTMNMGQTLVLAGFEQVKQGAKSTAGFLAAGKSGSYGRQLVIITIAVESVPGYTPTAQLASWQQAA